MKSFYLWILPLLFYVNSFSQISNITNCGMQADEPPGCYLCDSVISIRNDLFMPGLPGDTFECGTIENNFWISFIADGNSGVIKYTSSNCENTWGTQALIYNQRLEQVSFCFSSYVDPYYLYFNHLVEDQVYYLMVDGFLGDICTNHFTFLSGVKYPHAGNAVLTAGSSIPDTICVGARLDLTFNPLPVANEVILETTRNQIIDRDSLGLHYSLTFLEPGPDTIYYFANAGCSKEPVHSKAIFVNGGNMSQVVFDTTTCQNYCFSFRDTTFCETGIHFYQSPSSGPCDSVFIIKLQQRQPFLHQETITICQGDSITWMGNRLWNLGKYREIRTDSITGCDSIFELNLVTKPIKSKFNMVRLMENDTFRGNIITADTTIVDTLQTIFGCDSLLIFSLVVETSGSNNIHQGFEGLKLYPNPNGGQFMLEWDLDAPIEGQISILDVYGNPVFSKENQRLIKGKNEINLPSNIPSGLYHFNLKMEGKTGSYRIVIQR